MINFCHFHTGNGWFLDKIVIKYNEGKGAQEVVFPCNRYVIHGEKKRIYYGKSRRTDTFAQPKWTNNAPKFVHV